MRFKGRDINIVLGTFALVIVMVLIFMPVSKQVSSASTGSANGAVYESQYANDPIVLGPVGGSLTDNSAYLTALLDSPEQTLSVAMSNLINAKAYTSVSTGQVSANAGLLGTTTQRIKNIKIVNAEGRYSESVSCKTGGSVGVNTATQEYARNGYVNYRKTSSVSSSLVPTYTSGFSRMDNTAFNNLMGRSVCGFNYNVNNSTVDRYGDVIDNGDGTHSFWVYLNDGAAVGYRKQVKETSGYAINSIKYLRMYVTVYDSNLYFKSIKYEESYAVKPISKEYVTTNNILETFTWEEASIPEPNNLP